MGRPRQYDDAVERGLIVDACYTALREHGADLTIAHILEAAGVSTRSFYRHFESKDALLCAMYRRDGEEAAQRLARRVADSATPREAVVSWVDEIFGFVRSSRRAERVSVFRSILANHAVGIEVEVAHARALLVAPLRDAVTSGVKARVFTAMETELVAELLAVAVLHASGLSYETSGEPLDQRVVTEFCLRALGVSTSS